MKPAGASKTLGEYVASVRMEGLPGEVVQKAKLCVLDLLGVALAGTNLKSSRIAREFAARQMAGGEAALIGDSRRCSVTGAAFANCQSACSLDLDDGHNGAVGHAGSTVIPSAIAVAEAHGATGARLIEAVVAGYEVSLRIASSRRKAFIHTYASGPWSTFGACAAACRILNYPATTVTAALDLAGSHAPVRPASKDYEFVPMTKECIGWAGAVGTSSALLAGAGFTGLPALLDYSECYDQEAAVRGLGESYEINNVWFKSYASCRWTHPVIDAVLALRDQHGISPDEVLRVEVESFERASLMSQPRPTTAETAQYSIPWCVAAALKFGKVGPRETSEDLLEDADIVGLASRINIRLNPEMEKGFREGFQAGVVIVTPRGRFRERTKAPKGDPPNVLTQDELSDKFLSLAEGIVGERQARRLQEAILSLERLKDVSELTRLVVAQSADVGA